VRRRTKARFAPALALIGACLLPPAGALAIQDEIQVYTDDLDLKGESGVEIHVNTTPSGRSTPGYPGDVPPYHGIRFTPEFAWGLGHGFDWGLYLPSTTDADWNYYFGGAKLRVKWMPVRAEEGGTGWYFGINNEISNLNKAFSDSRWNDEVRVMGGYRGAGWLVGLNPIFEWGLSPGFRGSPDFTLAFKAVHDVLPGFALGVEYYQDMGPLSNPLAHDEQARTLYAVADIERKGWSLNFGIGRGLTPATDDWTVKAIVGVSFN
jgi:hypothetical protein